MLILSTLSFNKSVKYQSANRDYHACDVLTLLVLGQQNHQFIRQRQKFRLKWYVVSN